LKIKFTILGIILVLIIATCKKTKTNNAPKEPTAVTFVVPAGFPATSFDFANNPLTKEGIALGKKLFYDGILSKDGAFPCASCHQQFAAFATFDHDFSHGFNNTFTTRNAPALQNLVWKNNFHHDGGVLNLEMQALSPILAPNEMAEDLPNVISKLKNNPTYRQMFIDAFGVDDITSAKMVKAISQFETQLISANSKYDKVKAGTDTYTSFELAGYNLFKQNCASCHKEPFFTDESFRNIGLPLNSFLNDFGRMGITNVKADSLKFKVPSLRNVALTAPYMHDGRLVSLQAVFNHYTTGLVQHITTDPLVVNRFNLSTLQRNQIEAFLNTLTDSSFLRNPNLAE
jgi:cytochrome c peroxidase